MAKLYLDTDQQVISGDGVHQFAVTEDALAGILLAALGYAPEEQVDWLHDPEGGLLCLRDTDVDLEICHQLTGVGLDTHPHTVPSTKRMLSGKLAERAAEHPKSVALVLDQGPETGALEIPAADLLAVVSDVANRLAGEGIGLGDHIAVSAVPTFESIVMLQAAWDIGASAVLICEEATADHLEKIASRLSPKLWFGPEGQSCPDGATVIQFGDDIDGGFEDWLDNGPVDAQRSQVSPETEAVVLSSADRQDALLALSHRALFQSAHLALAKVPMAREHRHAASTDLCDPTGLRTLAVLPLVRHHASIILQEQARSNSRDVLEAFGRLKVSHAHVVPNSLFAAIEMGDTRLGALHLRSLVMLSCGTGILLPAIRDEGARVLGCMLRDVYGLPDCAGAFAWSDDGTVSSHGATACNALVRIVGPDGRTSKVGETGQVRVFSEGLYSGTYTAEGYVPRPKGWVTLNDLAVRQADGTFKIVGHLQNSGQGVLEDAPSKEEFVG